MQYYLIVNTGEIAELLDGEKIYGGDTEALPDNTLASAKEALKSRFKGYATRLIEQGIAVTGGTFDGTAEHREFAAQLYIDRATQTYPLSIPGLSFQLADVAAFELLNQEILGVAGAAVVTAATRSAAIDAAVDVAAACAAYNADRLLS